MKEQKAEFSMQAATIFMDVVSRYSVGAKLLISENLN